jgi:hypothetical protein
MGIKKSRSARSRILSFSSPGSLVTAGALSAWAMAAEALSSKAQMAINFRINNLMSCLEKQK